LGCLPKRYRCEWLSCLTFVVLARVCEVIGGLQRAFFVPRGGLLAKAGADP